MNTIERRDFPRPAIASRLTALAILLLTPWLAGAQPRAALDGAGENQVITRRTFTDLARKVIPSVVTVYVKIDLTKTMTPEQRKQMDQLRQFYNDPLFKQFFPNEIPGQGSEGGGDQEQGFITQGAGSGVIVSADGYIVTNWHVVGDIKNKPEVRVVLADNEELSGGDVQILESSQFIDLALLKINRSGLTPIRIGDSDKVQIGDWVAAVGSPLELKATITQGIISAKHREFGPGLGNMLQTDAPINPGSSGGALVDLDGNLIGLNRMIATVSQAGQWAGYGFAIPSNQVKFFVDEVRTKGHIAFGYVGLYLGGEAQDTPRMREALGLGRALGGVLVMGVTPGSPADKAGMQEGDFILSIDGQTVQAPGDLTSYVARRPVGSAVKMTFMRPRQGGKPQELSATIQITRRPNEEALAGSGQGAEAPNENQPARGVGTPLGVRVEPYRDRENQGLRVTAIEPGSPAAKAGVRPGDVLLKLNFTQLKRERDLERAIRERVRGKPQPLYLMRNGQKILIPLE